MNYYIHYRAGTGGDFLRVCLWLLLNPTIKINWDDQLPFPDTPDGPGNTLWCSHIIDDKEYSYELCGLLDNGSVKPARSFTHITEPRGEYIKRNNFGIKPSELAFYSSIKNNKNFFDVLSNLTSMEVKERDDYKAPKTANTIMNSHRIYQESMETVDWLFDYLKRELNYPIELHIGIMPKDPVDSVVVHMIDELKNYHPSAWSIIKDKMKHNDEGLLANVFDVYHQHKNMYDFVNKHNGLLLDFKDVVFSDPYRLAKLLSSRIKDITLTDTYFEFFEAYQKINKWENIFNNKQVKQLRNFVKETESGLFECQ